MTTEDGVVLGSQLRRLVNAPSSEVFSSQRDLSLNPVVRHYALILSSYLQGDTEKLKQEIASIPISTDYDSVRVVAGLRLRIRTGELSYNVLQKISAVPCFDVLEAEKLFCLGTAFEKLGEEAKCMDAFQRARNVYSEMGCFSKTLRCEYNAIASESRLFPHKNFVSEYQALIQSARKAGEPQYEGMAWIFLSREYQVVGLLDKALEMVNDALVALQNERGCVHYFHALLHKADILIDLGREDDARPLLKEVELAPFAEMQAARQLLLCAIDPLVWDASLEKSLLPTWRNRIPKLKNRLRTGNGAGVVSELEDTVLKLMYNGPIDKWTLITKIYSDTENTVVLENRFKNLIARIRKKNPDLVQCHNGQYSVAKLPPLRIQ